MKKCFKCDKDLKAGAWKGRWLFAFGRYFCDECLLRQISGFRRHLDRLEFLAKSEDLGEHARLSGIWEERKLDK